MRQRKLLLTWYDAMLGRLGPSGWWPGESPFEVAVGAVLTQNTAWTNAARAIANLRAAGVLAPEALHRLPAERLAELIRPAGYYRLKAARLGSLLDFLKQEADFDFPGMARQGLDSLRPKLLEVKGIGPETADSILLYALGLPTFVVDAYTLRLVVRHGLLPEDTGYHELRDFFMDALDSDPGLFNEYHALIVRTGKEWCLKKAAKCAGCPLEAHRDG
jgi:endonuclease-3 related protein